MHPLRFVLFACYFISAAVMVLGHRWEEFQSWPISDEPSIHALDDAKETAWSPPYKQFALDVTASDESRPARASEDETYIRPAWWMFAATVVVFVYLWTTAPPRRGDAVVVLNHQWLG